MNGYVVYMHKCTENGKMYIGITNNTKRRWRLKGIEYRPHKKENQNRPFWNAIVKYGWEKFEHITLESGLTFSEAVEVEKGYIELYDTTNKKHGYNVSKGGNGGVIYRVHPRGMKGKTQTPNQIKGHRIWASRKENNCMTNGQVVWGETHEHPKGMLGKTHSDEYKQWLKSRTGKLSPVSKSVKVTTPRGEVMIFETYSECLKYFDVSFQTIRESVKTGIPYTLPKSNIRKTVKEKLQRIVGYKFEYYSENTEVITEIKKSVTSVEHRG